MTDIVLASGNKKKLLELQALLTAKNVTLFPQSHFKIADPVEDGLSFVENAIIKARNASKLTGLPAIADDSGIEVDALRGAPGIYSARFVHRYLEGGFPGLPGLHSDLQWQLDDADAANNALLLELLNGTADGQRTARFQCATAMFRLTDDPMPLLCQGTWEGRIVREPNGTQGFG